MEQEKIFLISGTNPRREPLVKCVADAIATKCKGDAAVFYKYAPTESYVERDLTTGEERRISNAWLPEQCTANIAVANIFATRPQHPGTVLPTKFSSNGEFILGKSAIPKIQEASTNNGERLLIGWPDLVMLKWQANLMGSNALVLYNVELLGQLFQTFQFCQYYLLKGEGRTQEFRPDNAEPIYTLMNGGWSNINSLYGKDHFDERQRLIAFLDLVSRIIEIPILGIIWKEPNGSNRFELVEWPKL